MQGTIKTILKKLTMQSISEDTQPIESSFNEQKISEDSSSVMKETAAAEFNKVDVHYSSTSKLTSDDGSKCPRPNVTTFLILFVVIILFMVIPIINLLHFFHLLNSQWSADEFNRVMTDHSHSNPRKEIAHEKENTVVFHNIMRQIAEKVHSHHDSLTSKHSQSPPPAHQCSTLADSLKFDCFPEGGADKIHCEARGCCWSSKSSNEMTDDRISLGVPYCFYPPAYGGYRFLNITETRTGSVAFLQRIFKSPYLNDISLIRMDIKYEAEKRLRIQIKDAHRSRFEPPYPEVPIVEHHVPTTDYIVQLDKTKTGFKVLRKSDGVVIFDTQDVGALIYADQFLQLSALLPSPHIYGLGEHRSPLELSTNWQRFIMFNHDHVPEENVNLYGSHPFYLIMEESGKSHGVFLLNSNAMEIILQPAPAITFRTLGGILDFFIFMGPTPQEVVQQYTDIIGRPFLPPYWGLGFHLCRFGYKSLNRTKEVWSRTRSAGIPLYPREGDEIWLPMGGVCCFCMQKNMFANARKSDVQWNDLDYMEHANDFTYDKVKFEGLPEFVEELHKLGMHYVPLIDAGVSAAEKPGSYSPYDDGIKMDIFVKDSEGKPFVGKVWNRVSTVWPDFTHPHTVDYWLKQMQHLHGRIPFDGAWIDMNEPSNFWSGTKTGCPNTSLNHPQYVPAGLNGNKLYYNTLCMSSTQKAGIHYNVHNLYGFTEAIVTSFVLREIREKRPFVISRSTFSGHGQYAGHWTGDNLSSWTDMKKSVAQILNFNLFGIPLVGADICGFNGNTSAALCQRWSQLGAFYPFSRNHNTDDALPQDPVALGPEVVQSARKALLIRYSLLPYLYTLFWKAHAEGDTVARPLFFEFPSDVHTYDIDEQFLWGSALMIIPVFEEGKTEVSAYLPDGLWYDFYTLAVVQGKGITTLPAPLDTIPLLIRGGSVIPTQAPNMTTTESRLNDFELVVALDKNGHASGCLYWDDGESLNTYQDQKYSLLNFTVSDLKLTGSPAWWHYNDMPQLSEVTVLGLDAPVESVFVNQASKPFSYHTINKLQETPLNLECNLLLNFLVANAYGSRAVS